MSRPRDVCSCGFSAIPTLGEKRLGVLEPADVASLLREMRRKWLSESRCHHVVTVLRAVYRLARSRRLVSRSPLDELDPSELPKRRNATDRPRLDEQELASIVRHAEEPFRIAVALLAFTGLGSPRCSRLDGRTSIS